MSETTALTRAERSALALAPDVQARVAENKARNAAAAAIRGTMWAKDLSELQVRAVAEYCRQNALDPVRHVEVLGGRIYLTSTLYEERAVPLVQAGICIPHEPDFINADPRLDEMEAAGDAWAKEENARRKRLRIKYRAPENAEAIVVQRITIASTGRDVIGVNWCGKGLRMERKEIWAADASGKRKPTGKFEEKDMDPVGGNEPSKTAITRAGRRAWKLVASAVPAYGETFERIERTADAASETLVEIAAKDEPTLRLSSGAPVGHSLEPAEYPDAVMSLPQATNAETITDAHRARAKAALEQPDPYGEGVA